MNRLHAGLIFATLALPLAGQGEERYTGMCDASAAVSIGKGRFVVADDELDVLRIYQKSNSCPGGSAGPDRLPAAAIRRRHQEP